MNPARRVVPLAAWFAIMVHAGPASAQAGANIGERLKAMAVDLFGPTMIFTVLVAAVLGLYMVYSGIVRMAKMSLQDRPDAFSSGFKAIFAGALLIGLPYAAGIGLNTVFDTTSILGQRNVEQAVMNLDSPPGTNQGLFDSLAGGIGTGTIQNCMTAAKAVPCMAKNLADNVVPIGIICCYLFAMVVGFITFCGCIRTIGDSRQPGEKFPPGWVSKFIFSVILMNAGLVFSYVSSTVFGDIDATVGPMGLNAGSSLLTYKTNISETLVPYEELFGSVLKLVALAGYITMVKGLLILKDAQGDRGGQATFGSGITHILAGVVLANFKAATCAALSTVGFASFNGLAFCS